MLADKIGGFMQRAQLESIISERLLRIVAFFCRTPLSHIIITIKLPLKSIFVNKM